MGRFVQFPRHYFRRGIIPYPKFNVFSSIHTREEFNEVCEDMLLGMVVFCMIQDHCEITSNNNVINVKELEKLSRELISSDNVEFDVLDQLEEISKVALFGNEKYKEVAKLYEPIVNGLLSHITNNNFIVTAGFSLVGMALKDLYPKIYANYKYYHVILPPPKPKDNFVGYNYISFGKESVFESLPGDFVDKSNSNHFLMFLSTKATKFLPTNKFPYYLYEAKHLGRKDGILLDIPRKNNSYKIRDSLCELVKPLNVHELPTMINEFELKVADERNPFGYETDEASLQNSIFGTNLDLKYLKNENLEEEFFEKYKKLKLETIRNVETIK